MPDQQQPESGIVPLKFEVFAGLNTATTRMGVPDEQAYWFDGFFPLAPRNLRTLYGIGSALYTAPGALTIVCFYFYNLGATPYAIVFLSDGSAVQVNTATSAVTAVMPAGTITSPSITSIGITQSGEQYLIIVADQANGYWLWDGINLYAAGTLGPQVLLTSGGAGYQSVPTVTATGGSGHGAQFVAQIGNGVVTGVSVINPGTGYLAGQTVSLIFTGGTQSGTGGTVSASMTHVAGGTGATLTPEWIPSASGLSVFTPSVSISVGGSGYGSLAVAQFATSPSGSGWGGNAPPSFALGETSGTITTASLVPNSSNQPMNFTVGSVYSSNAQLATVGQSSIIVGAVAAGVSVGLLVFDSTNPKAIIYGNSVASLTGVSPVTVALSGTISSPGVGSGDAIRFVNINQYPTISLSDPGYYKVGSVSVISAGSNYGPNAAITATGGGSPFAQAVLTPNLSNGSIAAVNIVSGGIYGSSSAPTLTVSDSAALATGTVELMPFGIDGNAVQTYQGHVWVFNGADYNLSAPGSVTDFATSDGGGSDQSNSNTLKVGYVALVSTNGFLFLIGDSSMDYISGVATNTPSGGSPTTTFTLNNSDPETGTPYPAAVTTLGQDIFIANPTGVFVSSGGAFVKKSEALDGVYNSVANFAGMQLSAAKATIFGKRVWMVLAPIVDPVSNVQVNKLLMFNGKYWWTSMQDVALNFICGQEINSTYTAWGTDGTHIYPLFNQPSTAFQKVVQSKLWDEPGGHEFIKAVSRFWSLWQCYNTSSTSFFAEIDAAGIDSSGNQYTNTNTYTISGPVATGYFSSLPEAVGQQGIVTGITIKTNAADMALASAKIAEGQTGYRG